MVTKRKLLAMIEAQSGRIAGLEGENASLRDGLNALRERVSCLERRNDNNGARAQGDERAQAAKAWIKRSGDFRASHPFRPDQGRKD